MAEHMKGKPKRIEPGPGQESVWDYPRPPRLEDCSKKISVLFNGEVVAETRRAKRVLETSHPPTYYIPPEDVGIKSLKPSGRTSFCEWKGRASYFDLRAKDRISREAAWAYPNPSPVYSSIRGYVAFYASKVDACYVGDEKVTPQEGDFYGGWITKNIAGPLKGSKGTEGW
jgi:uncharacterized protein (DUF427 family)